jgi:hypothetical protein
VVLLIGAEINAEIEHAAARRGALTAKAPGEQRAPADEEPEGGAWPLPGRALTEDVAVAGRVIERWVVEARRRGWAPIALLGSGVLVGWLLRRRSLSEVAGTGGRLARTTMQIAAAIAAIERSRGQVDVDDKTVDEEPTEEKAIEQRAA